MHRVDPRDELCAILGGRSDFAWPRRDDARSWERLAVSARREDVGGLLLQAMERCGAAGPVELVEALASERDAVRMANAEVMRTLREVTRVCGEAGIDVMALKGAALLLTLYDDVGLRPMSDLDLLIHPADTERFDRAMRRLGYRRGRCLVRKDFFPKYYYEAEYVGDRPGAVRLDVHVRPFRPLRCASTVPDDALWNNVTTIDVDGAAIAVPGNTEMLAHLVCHAAFHGAERLLWLADIDRFVRRYGAQIDWSRLMECLDEWRLTAAARMGFDRVESAFGPCVPNEVRDRLTRGRITWRDRLALWHAPRDAESPFRHVVVNLLTTPGIRFRLGYLQAVALPDAEHMRETYGGWLGWGYVWRLLRKLSWRKVET